MSTISYAMDVSNSYDMRLSVEDSTEMPLLLTDLVKVVRPGAVTPVAAGMLMSKPTAQEQEKGFYCFNDPGPKPLALWRSLYKISTATLGT